MAKGDQEDTMKDIKSARTTQNAGYADYLAGVKQQGVGLDPQARNERGQLWDTGTRYAANGGITDEAAQRLRDSGRFSSTPGSSGGGGISYGGPAPVYGNPYASNGGRSAFSDLPDSAFKGVNWNFDEEKDQLRSVNPIADALANENANRYGDVRDQIGRLNEFGATGGMTQDNYNKIDRDNFYEFEKTGGYSNPQLADIRARSNSTVPAFYQGLQDQMTQNRLRSGNNYNSGAFDASSAKMSRLSAQQAAEQTRNTETDIADRVRTGRMQASQAIAGNELNLLQTLTPAKQQALSSAAQNSNQLASTINTGLNYGAQAKLGVAQGIHAINLDDAQIQLAKAKGIDDYTINVATGKDRYATTEDQIAAQERIANAGIAASSASARYGIDRSMDMQQAQLNSLNERYLMGTQQQGQEFGMGQLADIYRSSNGPQNAYNQAMLAGLNGYSSAQNQNLGIQANVGNQQGGWSQGMGNLMQGLGGASNLLKLFGGGAPGFGNGGYDDESSLTSSGGNFYANQPTPRVTDSWVLSPNQPDNPSGGATPNPTGPQESPLPPAQQLPGYNNGPLAYNRYSQPWGSLNYGWA